MKNRRLTKLIAVILSMTFFFSAIGMTTASAATTGSDVAALSTGDDVKSGVVKVLVDVLDTVVRTLLKIISGLFGDGPGFKPDTEEPEVPDNYYEGTGTDFSKAGGNAWYLGYSSASLVPENVFDGEHYIGGYIDINNGFTNVVESVIDDMRVRCIALSDGVNGTVLFATIDCIGITNNDIRDIRELLKDFAEEHNIVGINISATHCHSCIDTEGLWTKNIYKIIVNGTNNHHNTGNELLPGTNPEYMAFLKDKVASALKDAYNDLKPGKLTYSEKDIGNNYFNNKNRPSATALMTELTRFVFTPFDIFAKPTMIVNIAAHPDVAGLPTGGENTGRKISGDYVYYADELISKAGYNFMFFQGAIAGIYMNRSVTNDGVDLPERWMQSRRYGYEIARMALSMNLTVSEIKKNDLLNVADEIAQYGENVDENGNKTYSIWYEGWTPVTETVVSPKLSVAMKSVNVPVSNDIIEAAGKLNLANYSIYVSTDDFGNKSYAIKTEVGYMELGNGIFKTVFLPGEVCQDLIVGGDSLTAAGSQSGKDFGYPCVAEIFGEGTKCFGLMNDAIGYIVPDNDFTMGDPANHYHEFIGLGQYVGSTLIRALMDLNAEIKR